ELARIRRQGWSYDNGEDYADVRCVAAPVFNANNELTAAISVVAVSLENKSANSDDAGSNISHARRTATVRGAGVRA
ncbi:IclR family transcriptional regulator C-terminal domain-containing protein, partial [Escherichia coli]|uniref:IclR family transcriptional regulator C-terminal domain-containing protein n=1 Tax=Escherichia coli TaxID=562 RepID=UPI00207C2D65